MALLDVLEEFKVKEGVDDVLKANWYTIAVRKEEHEQSSED